MSALEVVGVKEGVVLEGHAKQLSLTMTALSLVTPWIRKVSAAKFIKNDLHSEIPLSEVSQHDHSKDCWIVLYDRVYDITHFLKKHPGGSDVLLEYAGRDATFAFRGVGHTPETANLLKPYLIGQLPCEECIYRKIGGIQLTDIPD